MRRFQHSSSPLLFREADPLSINPSLPLTRVSRSSNDPEIKNAARNEMIKLLTAAGVKGMDSERLSRKVALATASLGCRRFANTVFLQMIDDGPFEIVGPNIIYTGYLNAPGLLKIESEDDFTDSYVPTIEHPTVGFNSLNETASESVVNSYGSLFTASDPDPDPDACLAVDCHKLDPSMNPPACDDSDIKSTFTEEDEEMPEGALDLPVILESDRLLDSLVFTIGSAMGGSYPIGQLISDIAKGGVFTTKEAALAISTGPFHISFLAQVSYVPAEDKGSPKRRSKYDRLVSTSL